jgi:hypothetical protein
VRLTFPRLVLCDERKKVDKVLDRLANERGFSLMTEPERQKITQSFLIGFWLPIRFKAYKDRRQTNFAHKEQITCKSGFDCRWLYAVHSYRVV